MSRYLRFAILLICLGTPAFSQCTWVFNPFTRKLDCTGGGTGTGNVSTPLPSTANVFPQFADTNGNLSPGHLAQDPANGGLTPLAAIYVFASNVSENGGFPVFDCSVANYFVLNVTQNDTISLAHCASVNGAFPHFGYRIIQGNPGHTVTLPSGFSVAAPIDSTANAYTEQWGLWDGVNFYPDSSAFSSIGGLLLTLQGAPTTPPSGLRCWADSTGLNTECKNTSGNVSGTAFAQTAVSHQWLKSFDPTNATSFTTTQPDFSDLTGAATAAQLPSNTKAHSFGCTFDGGGAAIPVNKTCYLPDIVYSCTIAGFAIDSDVAETVTFKTWRVATGGTARPTSGNSISTSGVSLSSGTLVQSSTATDWTSTAIAAHDVIALSLTAVTAATHVDVLVRCNQ